MGSMVTQSRVLATLHSPTRCGVNMVRVRKDGSSRDSTAAMRRTGSSPLECRHQPKEAGLEDPRIPFGAAEVRDNAVTNGLSGSLIFGRPPREDIVVKANWNQQRNSPLARLTSK